MIRSPLSKSRPDGFTTEIYKTLKKQLTFPLYFSVYSKNTRKDEILLNSYEASITLTAKTVPKKRKNHRPISLRNKDVKIPSKILANQIQLYIKKII